MLSPMLAFLLLIQPINNDSHLLIEHNNEKISDIKKEDFAFPIMNLPFIDMAKYNEWLNILDQKTYIPPKDAYVHDNGSIVKEKDGKRLHKAAFTHRFYRFFYSNNRQKTSLPMLTIHPRVDRDLMLQINVKNIGQYVTYFNSRNKSRTQNISLAAQAINNTVIFPGDTFSFNQTVGKRTTERGYLKAPVIVRGELSEDIGGGICQVSSTLFNAADRAGVKIMERYSHSKRVPYVPSGRDATVSWYGPDFTFQNQHQFPLLIRARVYGGQLVVKIMSSDEIDMKPRFVPEATKMEYEEIKVDH